MKKQAWFILFLIALVAGVALAATNMVTAGPIEQQRILAIEAARKAVFPEASSFEDLTIADLAGLDSVTTRKVGHGNPWTGTANHRFRVCGSHSDYYGY